MSAPLTFLLGLAIGLLLGCALGMHIVIRAARKELVERDMRGHAPAWWRSDQ